MPEQPDRHIQREARQTLIAALRAQSRSGVGTDIVGAGNPGLEALKMGWEDGSFDEDTGPRRRNRVEYVALPDSKQELHARGMRFLENVGLSIPEDRITVVNRDDLLEINITDSSRPDLVAQATLTVTRKGEAVAASLGGFLGEMGALGYVQEPAKLDQLAEQGMDLTGLVARGMKHAADSPYEVRDQYEIGDDESTFSLSGAMHLMETVGELCTTKRVTFAQPLLAIATSVRARWPYQSLTSKELLVLTEGMPPGYGNVADLIEAAPVSERKKILRSVASITQMVRKRLAEKRGIVVPIEIPEDEIYTDGKGHFRVVALGFDPQEAEKIMEIGIGDNDNGDEGMLT